MKVRRKLVIGGALIVAVLLFTSLFNSQIAWMGGVPVRVNLRILDSHTGAPIPESTAAIIYPGNNASTVDYYQMEVHGAFARADSEGALQLMPLCGAGGSSSLFGGKTGRYHL